MLAAQDVPLAVASSSAASVIFAVLEKLGLTGCFRVVQSAEFEPYGKPHPGVYLTAARRLGVAPEACVAIEDSVTGVVAAKAAKMACLAVPAPTAKDDRRFGIADAVLPSLADLDVNLLRRYWLCLAPLPSGGESCPPRGGVVICPDADDSNPERTRLNDEVPSVFGVPLPGGDVGARFFAPAPGVMDDDRCQYQIRVAEPCTLTFPSAARETGMPAVAAPLGRGRISRGRGSITGSSGVE